MIRILTCRQTEAWDGISSDIPAYIEIICDDVSELPADATAIVSGFSAVIGSLAHVVSNQLDYEMQSDGTWVVMENADLQFIINTLGNMSDQIIALQNQVLLLDGEVDDKCSLPEVYGMGTVLQPTAQEPADMNDVINVGAYTCSATYIANLANRPENMTSVNLYFEVRRLTSNRWMQTAYYQSSSIDCFYIRWKTVTSWTGWYKFAGSLV